MQKKTIVIGTLDQQVFEHLQVRLSNAQFHVQMVQSGVKVLLELLDNKADLLILDLDLAGVMGIEILPVIRRIRPRLPVIIITDDMNSKIRKLAAEMGVTYQAYKPMSTAETQAIAKATERLMERQLFEFASL
ncbi:response regulator [candidate division KSB1 bacterium]|nr:response regulator [candidate division KSB1 bacterium]RQW01543.1 MAG: response regulator [candidate division KSB1 bacterium]